ncbi:MAG: hypothetical protein QOG86_2451 [Thermoleophilaceae bacterium]|nr:hypothetical protein [Thermoleophilaceae bacterium]
MESNARYFARRASEEMRAAERAVTAAARARRRALAESFLAQARQCGAAEAVLARVVAAEFEPAGY